LLEKENEKNFSEYNLQDETVYAEEIDEKNNKVKLRTKN